MNSTDLVTKAVLRFQMAGHLVQDEVIRRGGRLTIDYDPDRLTRCRQRSGIVEMWNIEGFVRFHPGGGVVRGDLLDEVRSSPGGPVISHVPAPFEVTIPPDTRQIEVWFHSFADGRLGKGRCDAWDSQSGQNYWFDVAGPDPLQPQEPVRYRDGATPGSPEFVNVIEKRVLKQNVFPTSGGAGLDLRTSLAVRAWVKNIAPDKNVWIDVHVFDHRAMLINSTTVHLVWETSSPWHKSEDWPHDRYYEQEVGDVFQFEGEIYRGVTASSDGGSVPFRPDALFVQFRLYYEAGNILFTDAILHQLNLPDDGDTSRRGIWMSG